MSDLGLWKYILGLETKRSVLVTLITDVVLRVTCTSSFLFSTQRFAKDVAPYRRLY